MVVVKFAGTLGLDLGRSGFEQDLASGTLPHFIDLVVVWRDRDSPGLHPPDQRINRDSQNRSVKGVISNITLP